MPTNDIKKIKLGNTTYNIKDELARTAISTSSLVTKTNSSYNSGVGAISHIIFYEDSNKTTVYHEIPIPSLTVGELTALSGVVALTVTAPAMATNLLQIDEAGNNPTIEGTTGITVKMSNNKPVFAFNSTTDGTSSGTATEVVLPVGANGTIALLSDITTAGGNKVGYGDKTTITPSGEHSYDQINLYTSNGGTSLSTIPLSTLNTQTLNAGEVNANSVNSVLGDFTRVDLTQLHFGGPGGNPDPDENLITIGTESNVTNFYFMSGPSGSTKVINLPMSADGTIALTSDVGAVQNDVDAIKTLLNIEGTDVQGTIDKYDEIVGFLDGLAETPTLVTQLADKVYSVDWDESGAKPKITYKKSVSGTATTVVELDTTPTSGSKKPITSGGVYTAINNIDTAAVKKVQVNGKEFSPASGKVTLPDTVTKIQLNGKDQTLTTTASSGEGKVNLTGIVTNITFNNNAVETTVNSTNGTGTVALTETDPVFSASPAAGITSTQITNWDNISGGIKDVQYATDATGTYTKHLLLKKAAGSNSFTSYVELPTAIYTSSDETLELVLAKTPS